MADRFYISDHHWWHKNIIEYGERPFANVNEMQEVLLQYHNETVKPEDHVSFLGDVTMLRGSGPQREQFIRELRKYNGHKRLYLGNHDHWPVEFYREVGFEKVYATWRSEENILFSHIPIHPRSLGSVIANVHGHIHQAPEYDPVVLPEWRKENGKIIPARVIPYVNVSVEVIEYRPMHLDTLLQRIKRVKEEHESEI